MRILLPDGKQMLAAGSPSGKPILRNNVALRSANPASKVAVPDERAADGEAVLAA